MKVLSNTLRFNGSYIFITVIWNYKCKALIRLGTENCYRIIFLYHIGRIG